MGVAYGYKHHAAGKELSTAFGEIELGTSGAFSSTTLEGATVTKTGTGTYDVTFKGISKFQGALADVDGEEKCAVTVDNANSKLVLTTYNTSNAAADLSDETINIMVALRLFN